MVRIPDELPATVKQSFNDNLKTPILWPVVVKAAVREGITDVNILANIIFFLHHPDRKGSALSSAEANYDTLSKEWLAWRDVARSSLSGFSKPEPAKPGKAKPAARPGTTPRTVWAEELVSIKPGGFIAWVDAAEPGGVAVAKAGEIWDAPEGRRLIIQAAQWEVRSGESLKPDGVVTYLQLTSDDATFRVGNVYQQNREGFLTDIFYAGIAIAGKKLASTHVLIELEMNFLLGAASAVGAVFLADLGLTATEWVLKNKKNFDKWTAAIVLILAAREILKTHCPTLWDKIVDATLLGAWKGSKAVIVIFGTDIAGNIPESFASDKKKVAKAAGALLGKFGAGGFSGRLTALQAVWIVLKTVATQAALASPGAVKITFTEKKKAALDMIASLRRAGVALSEKDAEAVVEEVVANAGKVQDALEKLEKGFKALE